MVWSNVVMNLLFAGVFVLLNQWAVQRNFEETFVALALFYGCTVTIGNALFTYWRSAA